MSDMNDSTRSDVTMAAAVNYINGAIASIEATVDALQAASDATTDAWRYAKDDATKEDLRAALIALSSIKITATGLIDSVILTVLDRTVCPGA